MSWGREPDRRTNKDSLSISNNDSDDSDSLWGKKRKRKNSDQVKVLEEWFQKYPRWDKEAVEKAVKKSGLSRSQVYKWGWDQKKKQRFTGVGIDTPSKDEFGGYSKHDFVENDKSIANLLNIDLNLEIQKLELGLEPLDEEEPYNLKAKGKGNLNLVDNKKRKIKEKSKMYEGMLSPVWDKRALREANISKILYKTPNVNRSKLQGFTTPIKESTEKDEFPHRLGKVKQILFSESSNTEKEANSKSERKLTPSSENSIAKKSKSIINSSDLKWSEVLTPK